MGTKGRVCPSSACRRVHPTTNSDHGSADDDHYGSPDHDHGPTDNDGSANALWGANDHYGPTDHVPLGYSHEDTKAEIYLVAKHMRVPRALPSAPNVVLLPPLASVSIYDSDQDDGHITLACFEVI